MAVSHHLAADDLTLLHYDELPAADAARARTHLEACAACRAQLTELRQVLAMVDRCPVPEPGAAFEAQVWRRLQPALRAERAPDRQGLLERLRALLVPRGPRWAFAAGAVALVLVAFAAGRFWEGARREAAAPAQADVRTPDDLRQRILAAALGDHLDRAQGLFVDLASLDARAETDLSGERQRAGDLLAASRIYRRAATEAGDRAAAQVLEEIERALVEVTVGPARPSAFELQSLQQRIEDQELLFKLRVASSALRQREHTTRRPAARTSTGTTL